MKRLLLSLTLAAASLAAGAAVPSDSLDVAAASTLLRLLDDEITAPAPASRAKVAQALRDGFSSPEARIIARAILVGSELRNIINESYISRGVDVNADSVMSILTGFIADGAEAPMTIEDADSLILASLYTAEEARVLDMEAYQLLQTEFLIDAARRYGAVARPDGIIVVTSFTGDGRKPAPGSKVRVGYVASLADGTVFDTTDGSEIALEFDTLPEGLRRAMSDMAEGTRAEVYVPAPLAYGDKGVDSVVPPGSALLFKLYFKEIITDNK